MFNYDHFNAKYRRLTNDEKKAFFAEQIEYINYLLNKKKKISKQKRLELLETIERYKLKMSRVDSDSSILANFITLDENFHEDEY